VLLLQKWAHGANLQPKKIDYAVEYKCGKRLRQRGCSDVRVSIRKDTDYCRMCYRNHPGVDGDGNQMDYNAKKRTCKQSKMGCPSCEEPICKKCWGNYDHCVGL
jgi:hypothetical protein